jgi:hypothetical protein
LPRVLFYGPRGWGPLGSAKGRPQGGGVKHRFPIPALLRRVLDSPRRAPPQRARSRAKQLEFHWPSKGPLRGYFLSAGGRVAQQERGNPPAWVGPSAIWRGRPRCSVGETTSRGPQPIAGGVKPKRANGLLWTKRKALASDPETKRAKGLPSLHHRYFIRGPPTSGGPPYRRIKGDRSTAI